MGIFSGPFGESASLKTTGSSPEPASLAINSRFNPFAVTLLRVALAATLGLAGGPGTGGSHGSSSIHDVDGWRSGEH